MNCKYCNALIYPHNSTGYICKTCNISYFYDYHYSITDYSISNEKMIKYIIFSKDKYRVVLDLINNKTDIDIIETIKCKTLGSVTVYANMYMLPFILDITPSNFESKLKTLLVFS